VLLLVQDECSAEASVPVVQPDDWAPDEPVLMERADALVVPALAAQLDDSAEREYSAAHWRQVEPGG